MSVIEEAELHQERPQQSKVVSGALPVVKGCELVGQITKGAEDCFNPGECVVAPFFLAPPFQLDACGKELDIFFRDGSRRERLQDVLPQPFQLIVGIGAGDGVQLSAELGQLRLARHAVKIAPRVGATHDTLASVLSALGEFEEARATHLSKAADLYEEVLEKLKGGWRYVPRAPELRDGWAREIRRAEAEVLKEALGLERKAVDELRVVLGLVGGES